MEYFPYYGYVLEPSLSSFRIDFKIGNDTLYIIIHAPDTNMALAIARAMLPAYAFIDNIERME